MPLRQPADGVRDALDTAGQGDDGVTAREHLRLAPVQRGEKDGKAEEERSQQQSGAESQGPQPAPQTRAVPADGRGPARSAARSPSGPAG